MQEKNKIILNEKLNIHSHDYYTITLSILYENNLNKVFQSPNYNPKELIDNVQNYTTREILIFTNGSTCLDNDSVGVACFCPQSIIEITSSINYRNLVFSAECTAMYKAVKIVYSRPDHDFIILSGSLSALTCLQNPEIKVKTNQYILGIKKNFINCSSKMVPIITQFNSSG